MATKNVGYVVDLTGTAQVRTADGVIKVLNIGDMVSDRDLLITGEVANVVIAFNSGQRLQVGGHEEVLLDETVYAEVSSYTDEQVDELASLQEALVAMQQAILAGEDVDVLESAAAGSDKSGTEALHEASTYEREGREGEVDTRLTGFAVDGREINDSFNGDDDILLAATSGNAPVGEDTSAANTASATISVDNVTTDDIVNASEVGGDITITGSVGGDAAPGDTVNFTVNGTAYSGTVATDNTYSITVSGTDLATDNSFNVTVTGNDNAGNPFSATTTSTYGVDLAASATISIDAITADDIVNAVEAGNFVNVTGSVGGDATAGDTVSFTVNGTAYTGTVAGDSTFNISVAGSDLAADTSFDVTVAGTDNAGNPFSATTTSTHGVDTAASATITVDAITADDIVNAAESAGNVNVTGTVAGDAAPGDTVSFTVNGTSYSGTVAGDNSFSISVAGSDLAADTSFDVTVAGTDGAGNPFSAATTSTHAVDTAASATITVDAITTDDIVNAAEAGGSINVTGSIGGDAAPGDAVNFTVNGTSYSGTVAAGNTFSIAVTGSDLFADTSFDVTVSGTDNAGNPFSATTTSTHTVDAGASAAIALDVIAGDDTINAIESGNDLTITGTVTGDTESGDTVVVNIGGVDYSTTVNADNTTFSVTVPTVAVGTLSDGTVTATVSGTDAGGNAFTASTSRGYAVDTVSSATISVDAITSDDIVNAAESTANINVTGSVGGDATPGDTVSFTVNGTAYSGTVAADNTFSIAVSGADLAADNSFDVTVTGTDNAGNPFSETTTSVHGVDLVAGATISVDAITADDIVNAAESTGNINVTGSVGGDAAAGDTVSFTVNGTNYSGTVAGDNSFSISVAGSDLAADTSFDVTVSGTDNAGNPFSETTTSEHGVDTAALATITVDNITTDDIVNAAESAGNINVTGTVGGDATPGDTVSFTVNGTNHSGTVAADNTFSIAVSGADLAADTSFDVTVSGTDNAGNPFSETTTSVHGVDTAASATITFDAITADDIVNAAESAGNINVTGSVGGDAAAGDTVSFTVNGTNHSGTVAADNTFSIAVSGADLAADTSFDVTVSGTDNAGNPFSETTTSVHGVDTAASATITFDAITADDIVNAAESAGNINVTGSVGGDAAAGDTVSFTVNGTNYSGTVAADNSFSISVAGSDLAANTSFDVTVTGTDNAGNPFSETTTSVHGVDLLASATISVDAITADDIVNAAEAGGSINVTGSIGGDATPGDTVSFTVNGTDYSGTVGAGNTFSIAVSGADLAADNSFDVTVTGTDNAGNPFSATTTSTHTVDTSASATINVDTITSDDIVNAAESTGNINVTGSVGGDATPGDTVSFTVNGANYSGTVAADNSFSISVAGSDLAADTSFDVTVTGADNAGNPFSETTTSVHGVDTAASATITVDAITADDIVNAAESAGNINVTGSVGGDATPGDTVSFTVNGANYSGTVAADNSFSISVAGSDLAADTSFDVTVTGADNAGNPFSETTTSVHGVDTAASATITVDAITADDIVNAAESAGNINVTGSVGGDAAPGDTVSFTVNGTNYSGTVAGDNSFSISVAGSDLAADTSFDVTVSGTDNAGNPFSETTTSEHGVDTAALATITVDNITTDDIVNAAESAGNINVTGTVGGDATPGDTVSFTVNGTNYSGTVAGDNTFSIAVSGADLAADTSFDVSVSGTDNAGNPFSATTTSTHGVDTAASATITVDTITADDIVNAAESAGNINVTGSVGGDAAAGDTVSFTVNGTAYSGTVAADNSFSISVAGGDLAADNSFDVTVTGADNAGNPYSETTTSVHGVDTSASATINVDAITADDIVNAAESAGNINVTGSVAGDAAPGDTVSFTVNGTDYSGTVGAGNTFSIAVSGADLAADNSFDVTVTGTDNAGNPFSATTTSTHTVDTSASATINVDTITADDIVNAAEAGGSINVIGSVGGDAAAGDTVSFTVNGTDYSGTVAADSTFNISVAGSDLAADNSFDVTVMGTDSAGNPFSATATSTHGVDTSASATINVDAITADDIVNAAESAGNINVTGSVAGDAAPGDTVSFTVNGTNYSGTVAADNSFSIAVAGSDLAADNSFDVTVSGTDNAGNPFSEATTSVHGVDLVAGATISVDAITADDIVNAAESAGNINVTGSVGDDAAAGDTVSFTVNGTNYSGTVAGDNSFSISVAGSDLAADTSFDVTVSGTDNAGNPFSETTTSEHGVDTAALATITVDNITTDDIVNAAESAGNINVTGTVGGDATPGDTVSFTVNGTNYSGTVAGDNTFSIAVSGADLAADTSFDVTVSGTDNAGNPFSETTTSVHGVDTSASATISVDNITTDDIVNAAESTGNINVTGSVAGDATPGDTVSFTVNGTSYSGTVAGNNSFSISVAGSDLAADNSFDVTVTGNDNAGNPFSETTTSVHGVDTSASATITVDNITTDDIVNAAESTGNVNVTGSVGGDAAAGDTVSFTVNGTAYSGTVAADNSFSISVAGSDLAADNSFDVTVTGTDSAGNPFSASTTSTHGVDTVASATITVDAITADDIINTAEAGGSINVTGSIGGDAAPGDAVNFTVNGTNYSGTVAADNTFSIAVSGADLAADTSFDVSVAGTDNVGNPFSATTTSTHGVDTAASATITVDAITADDIVNAAESTGNINVTGSVGGDAAAGDTVSFTVNGTNYSGTVAGDNTFSIAVSGADLAADTSFDVSVSGTDNAGNPFSATTTSTHGVDTAASATITVDNITTDDIVNAAESTGNINVTGSVGGDAAPGDTVSFAVNGTSYSGTVAGDNSFSISVAGSDLAADNSFDVTVTGTDNAGNPFSETTTSVHGVDLVASATISVDAITADDIVNAAESAGNISVTGSVGGDAAPGDTVSFTVNGNAYSGTVAADSTFNISVAGSDLVADNSFDVTVTGNDTAGNPFSATTTSTHTVDTGASASIALDVIAGDDIINAIESGNDLTITGTVTGDAENGDVVLVNIGGVDYSTTVSADNTTFSVSVPAVAVGALSDGTVTATVSGTDAGGNAFTASTSRGYALDTVSSATITVDAITSDDIVNAAESAGNINVTGSVGGDAAAGDTVSFTVNGTDYSGTVAADNSFSISVAGSDLAADTSFDVTVTGADNAGNPFSETTTSVHGVDTAASATITVDAITADDIVNAAEAGGSINVIGSVGGDAAAGDTVSFTVNGTNYSGTVAGDNSFSISVAGSDLAADNSFDVTVTGNDNAGNPFSETTTSVHGVDTSASAAITVDNITTDDIVNAAESAGNINVTGSVGGDAAPGDTVSFTVNGTNYSGTVAGDNSFSISVAGSDLAADTSFDVTVSGTDNAGNPFSEATTSVHGVDTAALATITVDNITTDDIVNAAESAGNINVTGTVGGDAAPGDTVSFTVNGTNYSDTVAADSSFNISVAGSDLAADNSFDVTVTGNDTAGNPFSATTTSTHTVDTGASASIALDVIAGDDIINAIESGNDLTITGTVTGDAENGDVVLVNIGGVDYSTTVSADNTTFSVSVPAVAVGALSDGTVTATVSGTDAGGNAFTASTSRGYVVDTVSSATISVNDITADDIVNAAEAGGSINVTGTLGGDAAPGDTVSFTVNGANYSGMVGAGNTFSISVAGSDLAADTSFDMTVTGTDAAGNPFSETTTSIHGVDTTASATIVVNDITADGIVNAAESASNINVTGSVGGDAAPGDTVSFTVNGANYSGVVGAGNTFSIAVSGADLAADTSFDATVTGTDAAGNPFSETTTSIHGVDTTASATISVDAVTADDIVNAAESAGNINVTGTVGGDAAPGDTVSFTVNSTNYSGTVAADNTFNISIAGTDLAADTSFDVTVTGADNAGNPYSETTTSVHGVDTSASATINVDAITADDIVNAAESAGNINVTGSVAGDAAPGDTVSFTVNGTNYSGTVAADNSFSIAVSGADLSADNSFDVTVTGADNAGNPYSETTTSVHGVDTAASATINVDTITADDIVNAAEAGGSINVIGSVGGDAAAGDTVSFTVNGTDYSGTVAADSTFNISVAGSDLAADNSFDVTVMGTDSAGNPFSATATSTHGVDTSASATINVDAITADDIVNAAESAGNINVTGSVAGDAAPGDTVSFTVNGTNYSGTVAADSSFSIAVAGSDLAADNNFDVTVSGTDNAGNPFSEATTSVHGVDLVAGATISVDAITADDIVNAAESTGNINVTGSVGGDAAAGDTVSFTVNGTNYSGTVAADNSFSISVAGSDLAADNNFDVTIAGTDNAGNPFSATTTSTHGVDTSASAAITVDAITADDIVNAAESAVNINVTGSVAGDAAPGDTVSFTVNGTAYSGTVAADSTFNISVAGSDLAADTSFDVSVAGTDNAGNPFSETTTSVHGVDTAASATINVDTITADDIVNAAESAGNINVTGSVDGDAAPGDTVSFTVNGTAYSGTVAADNSFSISVAGSDLAADTSFDVSVAGTDNAGNPFSATTTSVHGVDTAASATINVDTITADDIVNATESAGNINVTGSVGGDAAPGDTVSFNVNGTSYSGTVAANNTFSIAVSGADLAADNSFDVTVTGNDSAGNTFLATATSTHGVDTTAPTITINAIAGDDIIDDSEDDGVTISGTTTGVEDGQIITVNVAGTDYTATVTGNSWSIPGLNLNGLADETGYIVTADVSDAAGNPAMQATRSFATRDTTVPIISVTANDVAEESVNIGDVIANFSASEPDGEPLTYQLLNDPSGYFVINGNNVELTAAGVAAINDDILNLNTLTIEVEASDGINAASDSDISNVTRVNDAPIANDDAYTVADDTSLITGSLSGLLINDTDAEGDTLQVTQVTVSGVDYAVPASSTLSVTTDNGVLDIAADGSFDYTPDTGYIGTETFNYSITDGNGGSSSANFSVEVDAVAEAPTDVDVSLANGGYSYSVATDKVTGDTYLWRLDMLTGEITKTGTVMTADNKGYDVEGLVYDASTGYLYGAATGLRPDFLKLTIDPDEVAANGGSAVIQEYGSIAGNGNDIADVDSGNMALTIDAAGTMYLTTVKGNESVLYTVDQTTGELSSIGGMGDVVKSFDYHPDTGSFYGLITSSSKTYLHEFTLSGGSITSNQLHEIGQGLDIQGMAAGPNHNLWAVDRGTGDVLEIDIETGTVSVIVSTPVNELQGDGFESLAIGPRGNGLLAGMDFTYNLSGNFGTNNQPYETHYFLVGLSADALANGLSVVDGQAGVSIIELAAGNVYGVNEGQYIRIEADAALDPVTGVARASVDLTAPLTPNDFSMPVYAVEQDLRADLNPDSNYAVTQASTDQLFPVYYDTEVAGTYVDADTGTVIRGSAGIDDISGADGDDYIYADAGNDTVTGGLGNDRLHGGDGDDTVNGGLGNDKLFGGLNDDSLLGGSGIDILNGGLGNDTLSGGSDSDNFVWSRGDEGTEIAPASDVINDFTIGAGGDVLNLSDMLQGENTGNLTDYLHFESDGNGSTIIQVDTDGGSTFAETQQITLTGVDLTAGGTFTDQVILDNLLANGNLVIDQ